MQMNKTRNDKHGARSARSLTGVEDADDDVLAGLVEGRRQQPLIPTVVGPTVEPLLEAQKPPRPRGVRRPPPLALERGHHLAPLCRLGWVSEGPAQQNTSLQTNNCTGQENIIRKRNMYYNYNNATQNLLHTVFFLLYMHVPDSFVASSWERMAAKPLRVCL
jgi:hypothetical protein